MKRVFSVCVLLASVCLLMAQSSIDRPTYINKYRTKGAFLRQPLPKRTAKTLSAPVCINSYLWVYPIDLGYFTSSPDEVIAQINEQNKYGRNNWRIPTPEELMTMEDNASTIGLGDDIYLCTAHSNGTLRLVAAEGTNAEMYKCVKIGNTYWQKTNMGAGDPKEKGSVVTYSDAVRMCPPGYRLPTEAEYRELIASGEAFFEKIGGNGSYKLYFPAQYKQGKTSEGAGYLYYYFSYYGEYFVQENNCYFNFFYGTSELKRKEVDEPKIVSGSLSKGLVRYVLDK